MIRFFNRDTNNDRWIVDLYKQKRGGFFVEAGALDGIHDSSTYTLEINFDWSGILVEPGIPFNALKHNRPKSICKNLCLAGEKGSVLFCDSNESGYSGIKKTLIRYDQVHLERYGKPRKEWEQAGYKEKMIEAITLLELLESANAPRIIHYMGLDLEGAEYDVLKNFPFEEYAILAFSIEGDFCNELMLAKGYRMVENPFNTTAPWEYYFLHKDFEKFAF
jgi:hypothetical protein